MGACMVDLYSPTELPISPLSWRPPNAAAVIRRCCCLLLDAAAADGENNG